MQGVEVKFLFEGVVFSSIVNIQYESYRKREEVKEDQTC